MNRADVAVLRAASDQGVAIERYADRAHEAATGRRLSATAARRAAKRGHIRRHLTESLNFHYEITDAGREALRNYGGTS